MPQKINWNTLQAEELAWRGFVRWNQASNLYLCPLSYLKKIPDGTEFHTIEGQKIIKGQDELDLETRDGLLAFGLIPPNRIE